MLLSITQHKLNSELKQQPELDLQCIAKATEGFVARDLTMLVDRALHACVSSQAAAHTAGMVPMNSLLSRSASWQPRLLELGGALSNLG